jgi:hypothetical protein
MNQVLVQPQLQTEGIIYPNGHGTFAIGSPDGYALLDGQKLDVLLGDWIAGAIVCYSHATPLFVAGQDQSICGLCAGMRVRIHGTQEADDAQPFSTMRSPRRRTCRAGASSRQKKENMPCSK